MCFWIMLVFSLDRRWTGPICWCDVPCELHHVQRSRKNCSHDSIDWKMQFGLPEVLEKNSFILRLKMPNIRIEVVARIASVVARRANAAAVLQIAFSLAHDHWTSKLMNCPRSLRLYVIYRNCNRVFPVGHSQSGKNLCLQEHKIIH